MSRFSHDLTEGGITRNLLTFAAPFLLSNFLQAAYNMVDMLVVGQFCGMVGTSAVGIGGQITILVLNLISGLAVGGTVLIAQYTGAKQHEAVKRTVGTLFSLYAIAGVVMTGVMMWAAPWLLQLLQTPAEAYADTYAYLQICNGGILFVFGYNAVSAVLRGMGDSRHPLIFVAIAAGTNVVLDILLVGAFGMGPAGAALATIMSQALSLIISIIFLRRRQFIFDFHPRSFQIDKSLAKKLVVIGFPSSIQGTLVSTSFMFLTGIANNIAGIIGSTAVSTASKVNSIAILPGFAMQASISSVGGQNLGAGKPARAKKTMWTGAAMAVAISTVMLIFVQLFSTDIVRLFIGQSNDIPAELREQCIAQSALYVRRISLEYPVTGLLFSMNGLMIGAGRTLFCLINGAMGSILVRIPAAWIFGKVLQAGMGGLGFSSPAAALFSLIITMVYYKTGRWATNRVISTPAEAASAEMAG